MAGFRNKRFTIYDAMEASGIFDQNPSNTTARDAMSGDSLYKGPVEYPKMYYHPTGEMRVSVPGEYVQTLQGVKLLGQQQELISKIAKNEEEEAVLLEEGWHDHPAKAIFAGGGEPPPMTATDRISQLEKELARLKAEKASVAGALPRTVISSAPTVGAAKAEVKTEGPAV